MSKSVKNAIYKEGSGKNRQRLRKIIRRVQKSFLRTNFDKIVNEDESIPDSKAIVEDWDYSDYKIDYEHKNRRASWLGTHMDDDAFNERKKIMTRK